MSAPRIAVIGATGDVGRGIVDRAVDRGWRVAAVARNEERLAALAEDYQRSGLVRPLTGSVADDASAARLATALGPSATDAIVISVNSPSQRRPLLDWQADDLQSLLRANLVPHLAAARHLLRLVRRGGTYMGIGGGMADVVLSGSACMSVVQAGLRMFYRALSAEAEEQGVHIRELIIASMVNGARTRRAAGPARLTDAAVGDRVCQLIASPDDRSGPIHTLRPVLRRD